MQNDEDELGPMVDPLLLIQINDDERFSDDDLFQPHNFLDNLENPADVQHMNEELQNLERTPNRDWDESLVITDSDSYELDLFDLNFPFREAEVNTELHISFQDENRTKINNSFQDENQTKINISFQDEERTNIDLSFQDEKPPKIDHKINQGKAKLSSQGQKSRTQLNTTQKRQQNIGNIRYQIKLELRKLRRLSVALNRQKVIVTRVEKKLRTLLDSENVRLEKLPQK